MTPKLVDENGSEIDIYSEEGLQLMAELWTKVSVQHKIMYEPTWLGIPVIQYPGDMVMMQELIWKVRPEVIVETGLAHGGTAVLHVSLLELLGRGKVTSVEIDIRQYNKVAIKSHPLSHRIEMVQGSSVDPETVAEVTRRIGDGRKVLVTLDSNHSCDHVLKELEFYSPLVTPGSYIIAEDTVLDGVPMIPDWAGPNLAVNEFLATDMGAAFEPDIAREAFLITLHPGGWLKKK